jgi:hypothetical protein
MGSCLPAPLESQSLELDLLDGELHSAPAATAPLFRKVIESGACTRLPSLRQMGKTITLDRLIEAGAWADAAITLIGFELPNWRLRRLVCEDGEWLCSLSRQPNLPIFLDEEPCRVGAGGPAGVCRGTLYERCHTAGDRFSSTGSAPSSVRVLLRQPRLRFGSATQGSYARFMGRSYRPSRIHMRSRAHFAADGMNSR